MRFEKIIPIDTLKPFVKYFIISENQTESEYKVFPSSGLVVGFQYRGQLFTIHNEVEHALASAGVTGIADSYKVFKNAPHIGTILVYFTEIGFTHFAAHPAHELFNQSVSLDYIFDKNKVNETEERLSDVHSDQKRIEIIEQFLLTQLKDIQIDKLIIEAVRMIYQSKGTIKIKELNEKLAISQSPFEKRFRKIVGTSPKKFASIVRFNTVLDQLGQVKSLTEICYENNFFDQAHFIKDFRQYTGDTPEHFKRFL
ncbi:helix-turn-helix domain-containing protein [Runella zeae]|uniref:helix-turn-helix domain-containing protein n=1 Tax=Runella zeae TaxID=94255 RepID=UPI00286DB36B|nr:helix-turn-helix domain-containing protein [Runella zeae]